MNRLQHPSGTLLVSDLACARGLRLLFRAVNVQLGPGELLHVQGGNGSGKTSLLRIVCGLLKPLSGTVSWRGHSIAALGAAYACELLHHGHATGLKDELSAIDNLRAGAAMAGDPVEPAEALGALQAAGLAGCAHHAVRELSQGQRKRVALTRLAVSRQPLWVLDEPHAALDASARTWLDGLIDRHLGRGGQVLLTGHHPVAAAATRQSSLQL